MDQVGLGVIGIGTAATLAATFALTQQYGELPQKNGNIWEFFRNQRMIQVKSSQVTIQNYNTI